MLLATAESGAREATVEHSSAGGRFHFMDPDGGPVGYDLPPKWARRIMRRIVRMAKGSPRHGIPRGRFMLGIGDQGFNYAMTRGQTVDGERVVLRLLDRFTTEG